MKYLLLIVVIAVSLASNQDTLREIQSTEFGKTLLQSIQLTLNQEDPASFDKVINLLTELKNNILNDQSEDNSLIATRQEQCETNQLSASEQISNSENKKAVGEEQLPILQSELSDKLKQSKDKEGEELRNLDRITALTVGRKESKQIYEDKRNELTSIIGSLQEAKQIISQLKQSPSLLIQLKHHKEYFLNAKQRSFHTMIHILLVMMESKVEEDGVDKVINVIDNLIEAIFVVQKEEMIADDAREYDFIKQKTRFEFANNRLATGIAQLQADTSIAKQKILELENEIQNHSSIIDIKKKELNDWLTSCADAQLSHSTITDNRNEQLIIIEECIQLIQGKDDEIAQLIQKTKY